MKKTPTAKKASRGIANQQRNATTKPSLRSAINATGINDLSPANQKILLDMLTEMLREYEVDCYDMTVYASALGSGKALTPSDHEELKQAHVIARRMHGLARMQHRDD